jgi:Tol biopolymer transport system component
MKAMPQSFKVLGLIALSLALLAACASSSGGLSQDDQVATLVAATLNANGLPAATDASLDGEIAAQGNYGACANNGQFSLVYNLSGNIWLWVNGAATQLTNDGDATHVRISDDGCRIAYGHMVPNPIYNANIDFALPERLEELWVVASDGSGAQALANADFFAAQPAPFENTILSLNDFDWQPGTHTLAFDTVVLHEGVGQELGDDLYVVSADGGTPTMLLGNGQAGGRFAFSPDGQQIAFSSPTAVGVINADGSNLRSSLVTYPSVLTYSEYAYSPAFQWGPDSQSLMVAVPPEDGLAQPVNGVYPETALWYAALDGTPAFQAGAVQVAFIGSSSFSPDSGRIGYLRPLGDINSNQRELVIALSNGSNEMPTINLPFVSFLGWSPDNSQYIYSTNDGALHLFLGNVNNAECQWL